MPSRKIDPSILMMLALAVIGGLALMAALQGRWDVVAGAITGLFAVLHVPVRPTMMMGPPPPTQEDGQ